MSKNHEPAVTLDEVVRVARSLPPAAQEAIAHELMEQIEDFAEPMRTAERQAIIKERVARPFKAAPRDEVMAILRQYNPAL